MNKYNILLATILLMYQSITLSSNFISQKSVRCESYFNNKVLKDIDKMDNKSIMQFRAKNGHNFSLEILTKDQVNSYLNEIAAFRIKYFKEFPYLYEGNMEYERKYINGFSKDKRALLVVAIKDDEIVAVSTALPLVSNADILGDAPKKFIEKGLNPQDFFYFGEIIVKPEHQGLGIAKALMNIQESYARSLHYKKITLSTVIRKKNDPRTPKNYTNSDMVWGSLGFKKEDIFIKYEWPTIIDRVTVKSIENPMVFWTKTIGS